MEQHKESNQQVQNIKQYITQKIINQKIMKQQERKTKEMQYTRHQYQDLMKRECGLMHMLTFLSELIRSYFVVVVTMTH